MLFIEKGWLNFSTILSLEIKWVIYMNLLRHFDHAHNSDLTNWTPWYQQSLLLGYTHQAFKERGIEMGLWSQTDKGLCIASESKEILSKKFAEFAEDVYRSRLLENWTGELFPVKASVEDTERFVMERTLTASLGCLTFGVHLNGFVRAQTGLQLWVAKRSQKKPTFPGKLDNLVGGGQPAGISLFDNLKKECLEEAGIDENLASLSIATGTISYQYSDGNKLKRDVLFCYDLELPDHFKPICQDGEVDSFERLPINDVLEIIRTTNRFKYNCNLVIIDFAIRHGILNGDNTPEYSLLCARRNQLSV